MLIPNERTESDRRELWIAIGFGVLQFAVYNMPRLPVTMTTVSAKSP